MPWQFGALAPIEPRLAKKLVEPMTNILNNTAAKSVLYEAIMTCLQGLTAYPAVMKLCAEKLREFLEDRDPNRTVSSSSFGSLPPLLFHTRAILLFIALSHTSVLCVCVCVCVCVFCRL